MKSIVNKKDLKRISKRFNKNYSRILDNGVRQIGESVLGIYKSIMPKKTQALMNSTFLKRRGELSYGIYEGAKHGDYLRNGVSPHIIRPRNKKALAWDGINHPVAMVNHPGIKKHTYPAQAVSQAKSPIRRILALLGGKIIQ